MYEHRRQRPISRRRFVGRLLHSAAYAGGLVAGSLVIGTAGYHWLGGQGWIDSLLNAAMLLGGMGPVGDLPSTAGKLFAAGFALYAGMVFLIVAGLLLTPLFHRVLHLFHWEADAKGD